MQLILNRFGDSGHSFLFHFNKHEQPFPPLSIAGEKIVSFVRNLAESAVALVTTEAVLYCTLIHITGHILEVS